MYLARWSGFGSGSDSWEPQANITQAALAEFQEARAPAWATRGALCETHYGARGWHPTAVIGPCLGGTATLVRCDGGEDDGMETAVPHLQAARKLRQRAQ